MKQKTQTLWAILSQSIRQLKSNSKRELVITLVVLAGVLASYFLFRSNNQLTIDLSYIINSYQYDRLTIYYTHLSINFFKSFVMAMICYFAIIHTNSKRLVSLMLIITISMSMDLASIFSTDNYYAIKPFRRDNNYNFKDLYTAFEVTCVLYSTINFTLSPFKSFIKNYFSGYDVVCNSINSKSHTARKAQTKRG